MRHRCWLAGVLFVVACNSPTAPQKAVAPPPGPGSAPAATPAGPGELGLEALEPGKATHGFTASAVYLDGADQPIGARLVHVKTGFTLDYLRIESAPQGFLWVTTYPTSDKGEPHTQEHLLLGKGNRGRKLGSFEAMALAESSAFTEQYRTCYHFHTVAGHDVFWPVFEDQLDAMLNPDYTDEEIRREVRNFGIDRGDRGVLRLEEKGTVYNEMVRTYEASDTVLFRLAGQMVYGARHPLAFEAGGYPDAIRTMTPQDIRAFHDATYHLANMGMVAAFPSSMSLASVLDHAAALLDKEAGRTGKVLGEANLPKPAGAKPQAIELAEYPSGDTTSPSPLVLAWPATRNLDLTERTLLDLFLAAFGGDESTVLYKKLIDSKTRAIDLGASGVAAFASPDQGEPVMVWVSGVAADKLDAQAIGRVRGEVMAELARIAKLPDGDPALVAFNKGVQSRVTDLRRRLAKFLDSPPGFGFRNASSAWLGELHLLERVPEVADAAARAGEHRAAARGDGEPVARSAARVGAARHAVRRRGAADKLRSVRAAIVAAGTARIVEVGSPASHAAIAADVAALAGKLDKAPRAKQTYAQRRPIAERLGDHDRAAGEPRYVGLVDPATSSGVFLNSAPATALTDTGEDAILDYLASNTFTGHGAHSLFMKTWAAGLAYSNGVHPLVQDGQLEYYAERCPLLPQTLRFVIDQLKAAKIDPNIARYAIATAFESRVAASYEQRAAAMAGDITDGITPQVVKAFREKLLALAGRGDLAATLAARMPRVYGAVMPGFGPAVADGVYFVIGPAKQLAAYEDYLHAAVGKTAALHRLYPRDFWIPAKL